MIDTLFCPHIAANELQPDRHGTWTDFDWLKIILAGAELNHYKNAGTCMDDFKPYTISFLVCSSLCSSVSITSEERGHRLVPGRGFYLLRVKKRYSRFNCSFCAWREVFVTTLVYLESRFNVRVYQFGQHSRYRTIMLGFVPF